MPPCEIEGKPASVLAGRSAPTTAGNGASLPNTTGRSEKSCAFLDRAGRSVAPRDAGRSAVILEGAKGGRVAGFAARGAGKSDANSGGGEDAGGASEGDRFAEATSGKSDAETSTSRDRSADGKSDGMAARGGGATDRFTAGGGAVPDAVTKNECPHFGQRILSPVAGTRRSSTWYGALQASHSTLSIPFSEAYHAISAFRRNRARTSMPTKTHQATALPERFPARACAHPFTSLCGAGATGDCTEDPPVRQKNERDARVVELC